MGQGGQSQWHQGKWGGRLRVLVSERLILSGAVIRRVCGRCSHDSRSVHITACIQVLT